MHSCKHAHEVSCEGLAMTVRAQPVGQLHLMRSMLKADELCCLCAHYDEPRRFGIVCHRVTFLACAFVLPPAFIN
jgi:hypothetical protein